MRINNENELKSLKIKLADAEARVDVPFANESELIDKLMRFVELRLALCSAHDGFAAQAKLPSDLERLVGSLDKYKIGSEMDNDIGNEAETEVETDKLDEILDEINVELKDDDVSAEVNF